MASESILVVDDNPQNAKLVSFLLNARGYSVTTAGTADEALAILEREVPRLILMDLQLPGMDGLALTRKLKADPRTRDTVIAAFTAYAMKGDEARAREAGCDAYITKPIDTRSLPAQIAELLARGAPSQGPGR
jgi:CheY-like chemotaxis protein